MKKIIVAVICILSVVVGATLYLGYNPPNKNTSVSSDRTHAISMQEDDYVPSTITVNKGDVIVFTNDSKSWRWPASNLHPTHDIYAEFDPKEPIAAGATWSFQFNAVGSWNMHDHLAPYITGTVTVK